MEALSQNDSSPKSYRLSAKVIPALLCSIPRHPSNQRSVHKGKTAWWDHHPTSSNRL